MKFLWPEFDIQAEIFNNELGVQVILYLDVENHYELMQTVELYGLHDPKYCCIEFQDENEVGHSSWVRMDGVKNLSETLLNPDDLDFRKQIIPIIKLNRSQYNTYFYFPLQYGDCLNTLLMFQYVGNWIFA